MNINQTLREITMWADGNDHKRHAIAKFGRERLGISDFDGVHQLHADKSGEFVPEPEDGWPSRKKEMENALNAQRNKCYDEIWKAIKDGTISVSDAPAPPAESVNDPAVNAIELMDDNDTPPNEDDQLEQRLEEGGLAEEEAMEDRAEHEAEDIATAVDNKQPNVTERIVDETPNFLEMDEDLEEQIEDEVEVGEGEMLRGLNLIIREVVKEELKGFKGVPTSKAELKKLIKQTLKEAF